MTVTPGRAQGGALSSYPLPYPPPSTKCTFKYTHQDSSESLFPSTPTHQQRTEALCHDRSPIQEPVWLHKHWQGQGPLVGAEWSLEEMVLMFVCLFVCFGNRASCF